MRSSSELSGAQLFMAYGVSAWAAYSSFTVKLFSFFCSAATSFPTFLAFAQVALFLSSLLSVFFWLLGVASMAFIGSP